MESDVNATLSELERKLKELERELESVGRSGELDSEPAQGGWTPPADPVVDASAAPPPPPGATPFTASWHGSGPAAAPPPPPASPYNGAPPVRVTPPPAPWDAAEQAPPPPAWSPAPPPPPAAAWPPPPSPAAPPPGTGSGLHRQLDELLAFRDRLVRTTDELVSELSRVLTELGVDAPDPAATVLTGRVVVEAAPFGDLATLSAFEQALMRVPGVAGVHVRSLDAGRAVIDVQLAGPVALGAALRATATVAFSVSDARDGQLTVALHP